LKFSWIIANQEIAWPKRANLATHLLMAKPYNSSVHKKNALNALNVLWF